MNVTRGVYAYFLFNDGSAIYIYILFLCIILPYSCSHISQIMIHYGAYYIWITCSPEALYTIPDFTSWDLLTTRDPCPARQGRKDNSPGWLLLLQLPLIAYPLQILVEAALNIAVTGGLRPREELWTQLRTARHKNCIRQLVSTRSVPNWWRTLASSPDTARLLARCIVEHKPSDQQQEATDEWKILPHTLARFCKPL